MNGIVKIGLVQMQCSADPADNLKRGISRIKKLARKGAQIVCLPELFLTEYFCQSRDKKFFEYAEAVPGRLTEALSQAACEAGVAVITSVYEKTAAGKYFNTAVVIDENGKLTGKYRKMHIPDDPANHYDEAYYFDKGDLGFKVIQTRGVRIAPMVCFDQWFPEGARAVALKGAQILFYPTAIGWPSERTARARTSGSRGFPRSELINRQRVALNKAEHEAWQIIQRSHAIANNVFVVAVNRVGLEHTLRFWGTSFVSDPYGRVIAKAASGSEADIIAACDLFLIPAMRREWPFLKARRIKL